MKKLLVLLSLVIISGCQRDSDQSGHFKTILIKSEGEIETVPDMAKFQISLNCMDKSIAASKSCLVAKSNELTAKLLAYGIDEKDILTTAVDLHKSYSWRNNTSVFDGYNSHTSLIITVKNIDKLDKIYTELLGNTNLEVSGLTYSHSKLDDLENDAYLKALAKSGLLADKILEKIPESEKEILRIANTEISSSVPNLNERAEQDGFATASVAAQSVAINKGTVHIVATLYVEYLID
ncbi:MAG TPA: SIMPL domain-containing protein [Flavobacterium sp.]|jgi:uncharacterized protein YggE